MAKFQAGIPILPRLTLFPLHTRPSYLIDDNDGGTWGEDVWCPSGSFVTGFRQWEYDIGNAAGLRNIELKCTAPDYHRCDSDRCPWIESPEGPDPSANVRLGPEGTPLQGKSCADPRQFVTAVQVIYGGHQTGVVEYDVECDVPRWETSQDALDGQIKPAAHILKRLFYWDMHKAKGWEKGPWMGCTSVGAVCGVNTNVMPDGKLAQVKFWCCPTHYTLHTSPIPSASPSTSPTLNEN